MRQSSKLNKMELFEHQLRHYRIMELYLEMDRIATDEVTVETRCCNDNRAQVSGEA